MPRHGFARASYRLHAAAPHLRSVRLGREARRGAFARELRAAFEELGPAFIKLGQLISVRPDVFGPELVFEMETLRDAVPPLPAEAIRRVIERDLGAPPK